MGKLICRRFHCLSNIKPVVITDQSADMDLYKLRSDSSKLTFPEMSYLNTRDQIIVMIATTGMGRGLNLS